MHNANLHFHALDTGQYLYMRKKTKIETWTCVETNTFIKSHTTLLLLGIYFSLCSRFLQVNTIKSSQIVENLTFFYIFSKKTKTSYM